MAIPSISDQNIKDALKYIDENGVPWHNESTRYELVSEDGKKYPPKYVIAVAEHIANGTEIKTDSFIATEAKNFFINHGYTIEEKAQVKYELTITADSVTSSDERFSINNLGMGDNYKPLDTYFQKADSDPIRRQYAKGERKNTNQTLPKLACQIFEKQIVSMSDSDRQNFPICQYAPDKDIYRGIFSTVEEYKKYKRTIEYLIYRRQDGPQFVIYCWNVFSTIIFVRECLKRFGDEGDKFVLIYREKDEKETEQEQKEAVIQEELNQESKGYANNYSRVLLESKNIIFRGAPGTGKSYLAKEVAADIISNGYVDKYDALTDEQKKQVEFVQFHPSYDYSDFVEGLRPKMNEDGTMGFELQDGIFKRFVDRARKNYEDSQKAKERLDQELSAQEAINDFFSEIEFGTTEFQTMKGSKFYISDVDDKHIFISIPGNVTVDKLTLNIDEIKAMLESEESFEKITDITKFFGKQFATQGYSYDFTLYKEIKAKRKKVSRKDTEPEKLKKYIFIIDEINRGEISKILGELFFAIDPGYRGRAGEVSTQYANMHINPNEKFYIPDNVYIIGTMNDIDRSVDSFDFAMRRRFRFIEIKAEDQLEMLDDLNDEELKNEAIQRMTALNNEIVKVEDLNENYQIGASYFLKLKTMNPNELWTDCLKPLLSDYIQGMYNEKEIMSNFEKAYGYTPADNGETDGDIQNQG
ncbi:McrB family protein [Pseudobutyrivibrio sp.]|uniref:McrB family protein n=1 Tax=Pseudobutyrivibrio sp. TaxID=2014367 RepID=UPI0025EDFDF1|nr:AAA family ATPase [Pseudobutyrivibrio sp.]